MKTTKIMLPRPRKRFGQHFLTDAHYIARIVAAIAPQRGETLVEIGPGPGAITAPLIAALGHMHVVEIDRDLARTLREHFAAGQISVHECDALEFDFASLPAPLRVAGNLPYNISTPILFHVAQFAERIRDCTFMLQKEVVERMVARPSTPAYGRLSVMLQYRFAMKKLFVVPPGAFFPPPKVDSAIVRLIPLDAHRARARDEKLFAAIVTAAFGQRRKTLRNTLKPFIGAAELVNIGVDGGLRAENLGVAEFIRIADAVVLRGDEDQKH
jgi:16S rRNA (adenine1518-N6/adenine1519-N6)-dimethyltransferase